MRIGVLTSGGDCQGMNSVLYELALICEKQRIQLIGIQEGYKGLYDKKYTKIKADKLKTLAKQGGTILGSSRCQEMFTEEGQKRISENYHSLKLNGLIILGGDGSAKGAEILSEKYKIPSVVIPSTIDNDIKGVKLSLGFLSAVDRVKTVLSWIEDTAKSHNRIIVLEVMGRHSGNIAKQVAMENKILMAYTPEIDVTEKNLKIIDDKFNKKISNVILITELQKEKSEQLVQLLGKKYEVRYNVLGHCQRGGPPTKEEYKLAKSYARKALNNLMKGEYGIIKKI